MKHAAIAASRQCNTQASRDQCSHYSAKKNGCICTYTAPRGWDALGINRVSTLIRTGYVRGGGVTGSQAFSTWARPGKTTMALWPWCYGGAMVSMQVYGNLSESLLDLDQVVLLPAPHTTLRSALVYCTEALERPFLLRKPGSPTDQVQHRCFPLCWHMVLHSVTVCHCNKNSISPQIFLHIFTFGRAAAG